MRASKTIVLASNNRDKLVEFQDIFKKYPHIEIVSASGLIRNADKLHLVETHETYLENASAKARTGNWASHYPCLGDDSGLEIEALANKPGVLSRRFATPKAGMSQEQANMDKVLTELKGRPMEARKARFVCALALTMEGILIHSVGTLEGTIAEAPSGNNGFGYDPIFIPRGKTQTLAELSSEEKNEISHRAQAVHLLMDEIRRKGMALAKP